MSRIEVKIDRLVLRGLDPAERTAFAEGLRSELARILANPATRAEWSRSRRMPVLRLGKMPLEKGPSGSRKLGGGVASAIQKGMRP